MKVQEFLLTGARCTRRMAYGPWFYLAHILRVLTEVPISHTRDLQLWWPDLFEDLTDLVRSTINDAEYKVRTTVRARRAAVII